MSKMLNADNESNFQENCPQNYIFAELKQRFLLLISLDAIFAFKDRNLTKHFRLKMRKVNVDRRMHKLESWGDV
jgi:hypothetical protein